MSKCIDYWCEHYGKGSDQCDRCTKKENDKDNVDLRVILRRRADELMEIGKTSDKEKGQSR